MKKFIFIFALAIAAVACDTQPNASLPGAEESGILNIASGNITFTTEGGTSDVKVLSTDNWTARLVQDNSANKEEWCSINTRSGIGNEANPSIIKVTATPNSSYADRTAKLYVSSGNYNKSITITQKQMDVINVTVTQYNVAAEGEIVNVEVKSNVVCEIAIDPAATWITRVDGEGRAYATSQWRFKVAPNTTGEERQATIKFFHKTLSQTVTIIQAAASSEE